MGSTLRVAVINPPFPSPTRPGQWITVPPEGYGGVQWVVANLLNGLLALGHEVFLPGAPDSRSFHPRLTVIRAATQAEIKEWGGASAKFLGEVGGRQRLDLLARVRAVLVLSQPKAGPWGGTWCEPGATVVSEAAASGTPVIATFNGCLPEIVPHVGHLVPFGTAFDPAAARELLKAGPDPAALRSAAGAQWGHLKIASQYLDLYQAVISGACWQ